MGVAKSKELPDFKLRPSRSGLCVVFPLDRLIPKLRSCEILQPQASCRAVSSALPGTQLHGWRSSEGVTHHVRLPCYTA